MKIGKILAGVAGFGVFGPMGGIVGAAVGDKLFGRKNREGGNGGSDQNAAYQRQLAETRGEQQRMNERIESSRNALNAGIARGNRGRARGGIFGDAGNPGQPINPRLG